MSRATATAAIGIICTLALFVTHEALGHGLVTIALGAHLTHLTSVDSSYAGPVTPFARRTIAAAGIIANLIAGAIALAIFRRLPERATALRFSTWFFGHLTLFVGTSYLAGFAFLPFGDVHAVIGGLPGELVLQIACVAIGIAGYRATLLDAARTRVGTPEDVLVAYLAAGLVAVLSALLNPAGALNGALWSAAATFGAGYGLIAAAAARTSDTGAPPMTGAALTIGVARRRALMAGGVLAAGILFGALGPGVSL